jgi:hypothetical protein
VKAMSGNLAKRSIELRRSSRRIISPSQLVATFNRNLLGRPDCLVVQHLIVLTALP